MLRQYLGAGAGRFILFAAFDTQPGLKDLLIDDWGIILDDDAILDTATESMTEEGDLIIRSFAAHPITQTLIDYKEGLRIGQAAQRSRPASRAGRPPRASPSSPWPPRRPRPGGRSATANAASSRTPRASTSRAFPPWTPRTALGWPSPPSEVPVRGGLPFSVPGGKLVVFGTGDMISNARITDTGTLALFLGAVNWTVGRDVSLIVPARPIERFSLSLSAAELARLRYTLMLALPGIAALLGISVYWARRN